MRTIGIRERRGLKVLFSTMLWIVSGAAAPAAAAPEREVLSFEMWCLDIQQYPPPRCDTRRADDNKDYERYRAIVEQFNRERADRERRDQDLRNQLNRDPGNTKR
jgi:hypothetical protein